MKYLLDTCVLSEVIKPNPDPSLTGWLSAQKVEQLYISVLTLGELRKGIDRLDDGVKKHRLLLWLADLTERYAERFLSFDSECAMLWGSVTVLCERNGKPQPLMDSLIAATALCNNCTLVTRNEQDYRETGVVILNPWG